MPLQRFKYRVQLAEPFIQDSPFEVEITHADLLRAELEAGKQGLPVDPRKAPQQTTTLWVWAALVRTGVIDRNYRSFRDGDGDGEPCLVGFEQVTDPAGQHAAVDVDPTSEGINSPSASPAPTETSPDGSTLTPTNG